MTLAPELASEIEVALRREPLRAGVSAMGTGAWLPYTSGVSL